MDCSLKDEQKQIVQAARQPEQNEFPKVARESDHGHGLTQLVRSDSLEQLASRLWKYHELEPRDILLARGADKWTGS
jgi:hypothetical protein